MNYRQKLQTVQAWQFTPENREIPDWAASHVVQNEDGILVLIKGSWGWGEECEFVAEHWRYWIVKTPKGKFKTMDNDEFNRKYEASP